MLKRYFLGSSRRLRGLFTLLWWEAAFAVTYDTWIHPSYLNGLAGELKISLAFVSILAAIPWIGATGQIVGTWAFERSNSVKLYVLGCASIGRALWLIPLGYSIKWGRETFLLGTPFPKQTWFFVAALCACASSLFTSASANAWMYWMQALIPSRFQGRFFGKRQRFTTSAFIGASFIAASLVEWSPREYRIGLGLLGLFAVISGFISIYLHSSVQDVPILITSPASSRSLIEIIRKPLSDPQFKNFLFFGAIFNGAIQLANSYFPYYFTKELHFSMSKIAVWTAICNLGCFVSAIYWGKRIDRTQVPYEILWYSGHMIAFSPMAYFLIKERSLIQLMAPIEYFWYGLAWSGFLLAQTKTLFRLSPKNEGAAYFSTYAAVCGLSGGICTFLGGQLVQIFSHWGGFRLLWILAFSARLSVLWLYCKPLLKPKALEFMEARLSNS